MKKDMFFGTVLLIITFFYFSTKECKKVSKEINKEILISNDYAQAYDYCIRIRQNGWEKRE